MSYLGNLSKEEACGKRWYGLYSDDDREIARVLARDCDEAYLLFGNRVLGNYVELVSAHNEMKKSCISEDELAQVMRGALKDDFYPTLSFVYGGLIWHTNVLYPQHLLKESFKIVSVEADAYGREALYDLVVSGVESSSKVKWDGGVSFEVDGVKVVAEPQLGLAKFDGKSLLTVVGMLSGRVAVVYRFPSKESVCGYPDLVNKVHKLRSDIETFKGTPFYKAYTGGGRIFGIGEDRYDWDDEFV